MIPGRLPEGGWRQSAPVRAVVAALTARGGQVRFVGGCVRDALLGLEPHDIDIATADQPEAVMALARAAGLKVVPTGIDHGTVTVIADHCPVEVTTLRRDVETDGRHAVVAFTGDWAADAARRDFTINALYADPDGTLFDPVGGAADLAAGRVRFIGTPEARLAEDYLRGLRFFRFHARFAVGPADAAALAAIAAARDELRRLSAERIAAELLKILALPRAPAAVDLMAQAGVLAVLLPEAGLARLHRVHALAGGDGLLLLSALLPDDPAVAGAVASRLRLSRAERARMAAAADVFDLDGGTDALKTLIYRRGRQAVLDRLALAGRDGEIAAVRALPVAALPVKGADLLALGAAPGPGLGRLLAGIEDWWLAAGQRPDRAACLDEARRRLPS
ncbi:CCA tRNA nucleotidyltransferase [Zavarzinia compransoris]|uniref:CCA tRNA nucleotidyltransferase n=1 Tax=Zavarzinia compransoris TaxID=1264899 RepID=A0A317EAM9_9PROT|nr:CCA tRNA nucleotidyltransferase [Zavarzinia compransoris]PWR23286.1 CCA tRNA nucleotidyltransferase [Zavarzinia compransoris]TDP46145.1 poly(A) polymerase/tRNA nucleotidyltransferase (CCA-adding enzyme) [Zavarzinia compransoris]